MMLFCARPVSSFWTTPAMLEGTQYVLYPPTLITIFAATNITLDICVLGLPLPVIKNLNLTRRKRFGVASVFLLGALYVYFKTAVSYGVANPRSCLVCSIVRLYYTRTLEGFTGQSIDDRQRKCFSASSVKHL